jgi:type I restriction enzyme, S subunit
MTLTVPVEEIVARNSNGLLGKHESWQRVRLGDVANIQNGAAFKSKFFNTEERGLPLLRIRDVPNDRTVAFYDGPFESDLIVEPGDLVVGMDGDFNCALWRGSQALLNQRVCRIRLLSDDLSLRFTYYVLQGYLAAVNEVTASVTVKHLSSRTIADFPLPLPPRAEQDRIVEAIELLFGAVEEGEGSVLRAIEAAAAFRFSVLHAAFQGRLCGEGASPEWRVARLDEIVDHELGKMLDKSKNEGEKQPYLRNSNVQWGTFRLDDVKEMRIAEKERERYRVRPGDLMICEGGEPGRCAVWELDREIYFQKALHRVRPSPELNVHFLSHYLRYAALANRLDPLFTGSTIRHLPGVKLAQVEIPFPPRDMQDRLVNAIDAQMALADRAERVLASAAARVSALRHTVLRRAFCGLLVQEGSRDTKSGAASEKRLKVGKRQ